MKIVLFLDKTIPKFKGKFFLIGPQTFSAGQVLATQLLTNLATVIVETTINKQLRQEVQHLNYRILRKLFRLYVYMERPNRSKNDENHYFLI
jgi:hypothetical protein